MADFSAMDWVVAMVALAMFGGLFYWLIALVPKSRLMRCPETGSVVFVDVDAVSGSGGDASGVEVRKCELWPGRQGCARGCLARYGETDTGFMVNLEALRPFERR